MNTYVHQVTGQEYAVKVIESSPKNREATMNEIIACREAHHCENIVKLFEYFEEGDNKIYLVFEKIEGGDLFDFISGDDIIEERSIKLIIQGIARGLKTLHDNGVTHRDIKPDNVLLDKRSGHIVPKLCDFNLASLQQHMYEFKGSLDYMAPEVAVNHRCRVAYDKKSDMWSLGIVMYMMLFKVKPLYGYCHKPDCNTNRKRMGYCRECDLQTCEAIIKGEFSFPPVYAASSQRSPQAIDLIFKLLERNPTKRISASDVLVHPFLTQHPAHYQSRYKAFNEMQVIPLS